MAGPMKVGVTLPLSGLGAEYGIAAQNGIKLAQKDHPALFANIRFHIEDNRYDAKTNVTLFNKLREQNGIQLLHSWGDPTTAAIAPLAEKHHLPVVSLSVDPKHTLERKYVVRFYNYAEQYSKKMLEHIRKQDWSNIGVLVTEDVYSDELLSGIQRNLQSGEKVEVIGRFQANDFDFKPHIIRAKKKSHDVVVNLLFPEQVSKFYLQAAQLNYSVPGVGFDVFASQTEIESAKGNMNGKVLAYHEVSARFRRRYREEFGNDVYVVYACNAYELALLLARKFASEAEPSKLTADAIMRRLKEQDPQSSELGTYVFRDDPSGGQFYDFPIHLMRIDGDQLIRIDT